MHVFIFESLIDIKVHGRIMCSDVPFNHGKSHISHSDCVIYVTKGYLYQGRFNNIMHEYFCQTV